MRLSIPIKKKVDLAGLAALVLADLERLGVPGRPLAQSSYAEMIGGGWTQSKLSNLMRGTLTTVSWEQGEALRLKLGALPLIDAGPTPRAHAAKARAIAAIDSPERVAVALGAAGARKRTRPAS